jgi:hypothetical protein
MPAHGNEHSLNISQAPHEIDQKFRMRPGYPQNADKGILTQLAYNITSTFTIPGRMFLDAARRRHMQLVRRK